MVSNCIYFSPYSGLAYVTDHARDMMGLERTRALDLAVDRLNEAKIRGDEELAYVATLEIAWILNPQATERCFVG